MEEIKTIIYKCEFCGKYYRRKHFCELHEKACYQNPINKRACLNDCKHLSYEEITIEEDNGHSWESHCFYCEKREQYMMTLSAEYRGFLRKYDDDYDQIPMPLECGDFEAGSFWMNIP